MNGLLNGFRIGALIARVERGMVWIDGDTLSVKEILALRPTQQNPSERLYRSMNSNYPVFHEDQGRWIR